MAFLSSTYSSTLAAGRKPGLLARFMAALMEARQRQADREFARYIALNGGRLTDAIEHHIERRLLGPQTR